MQQFIHTPLSILVSRRASLAAILVCVACSEEAPSIPNDDEPLATASATDDEPSASSSTPKPMMSAPPKPMPTQSMPTQAMPTQPLPTQAMPTQVIPTQAIPTQLIPTQAMPTLSVPAASSTLAPMPSNAGGAGGMDTQPLPSTSASDDGSPGGTANLADAGHIGGAATDAGTGGSLTLPDLDLDAGSDAGDAATSLDAALDAAASVADSGPDASDPGPVTPPSDDDASVSCSWSSDISASTYYFSVNLLLTNTSDAAMDLRDIELLYYYSADGREATESVVVNDSPVGVQGDTLATLEVTGASPPAGADHYVLVSFADCSTGCTLAAGATLSRAVQVGLNSGTAGAFNPTNDYSYTPDDDDPCEFVVVLQNSTRIFGTPPEN